MPDRRCRSAEPQGPQVDRHGPQVDRQGPQVDRQGPPVLRPVRSRPARWALNAVGLVSLALGAVGVVLPLLPTTPFLLLSARCFAKASRRLLEYLLGHRVFGDYLHQYYSGRMTMAYKMRTLAVMWCGLIVSAWLIGEPWPWFAFAAIGTGVTIHLLTLKPKRPPGGGPAVR